MCTHTLHYTHYTTRHTHILHGTHTYTTRHTHTHNATRHTHIHTTYITHTYTHAHYTHTNNTHILHIYTPYTTLQQIWHLILQEENKHGVFLYSLQGSLLDRSYPSGCCEADEALLVCHHVQLVNSAVASVTMWRQR